MTTPERQQPRELTPREKLLGDILVDKCGLQDVAGDMLDWTIVSNGLTYVQTESVRYGLGHSSKYLLDRTPEEIREMVLTNLEEQKTNSSGESTV